mgnify:CR=1 FL=1
MSDLDWVEKPKEKVETYQERVTREKQEQEEKAMKLSEFIGLSTEFGTLDPDEQELMKEHCEIMWEYYEILSKRIDAFQSEGRGEGKGER